MVVTSSVTDQLVKLAINTLEIAKIPIRQGLSGKNDGLGLCPLNLHSGMPEIMCCASLIVALKMKYGIPDIISYVMMQLCIFVLSCACNSCVVHVIFYFFVVSLHIS